MSTGRPDRPDPPSFLVDRMLGTLCRYLRFMGYDAESACSMAEGNPREDTLLIRSAERKGRILLTRDRELARRAGAGAVLVAGDDVIDQIRALVNLGLIEPELRLNRCSMQRTPPASTERGGFVRCICPEKQNGSPFFLVQTMQETLLAGIPQRAARKKNKGWSLVVLSVCFPFFSGTLCSGGLLAHLVSSLEPDELLVLPCKALHREDSNL